MEGGATPVTVTLETELAQGGLEMVHLKTFAPVPSPVTVVEGDKEFVMVPDPEIKVQAPVPVTGVFAAMIAPAVVQTVWFDPAAATDGKALVVIVTLSTEAAQGEFEIDHVNIVVPAVRPVSVDEAERELVIVPGPETFIHAPTPAVGVFPAKVVEPVLTQTVWFDPAFAMEGNALPTIVTLSLELAQEGLDVVH